MDFNKWQEFIRADNSHFCLRPCVDQNGNPIYEEFQVKEKQIHIPKYTYYKDGKETTLLVDIYPEKLKDEGYRSLIANQLLSIDRMHTIIKENNNYAGGFYTKNRPEQKKDKISDIKNIYTYNIVKKALNSRKNEQIIDSYIFERSDGSKFALRPYLDEKGEQKYVYFKDAYKTNYIPLFNYYPIGESGSEIFSIGQLLIDIDVDELQTNNEGYKKLIADELLSKKRIKKYILDYNKSDYGNSEYIYMGGFSKNSIGTITGKYIDMKIIKAIKKENINEHERMEEQRKREIDCMVKQNQNKECEYIADPFEDKYLGDKKYIGGIQKEYWISKGNER